MKFEKLIQFLMENDIPLNSILFKASWMDHWYIPQRIDGSGNYSKLVCISPTRRDEARFDWSRESNIKPHTVVNVTADCSIKNLVSNGSSKVRVVLLGKKRW